MWHFKIYLGIYSKFIGLTKIMNLYVYYFAKIYANETYFIGTVLKVHVHFVMVGLLEIEILQLVTGGDNHGACGV